MFCFCLRLRSSLLQKKMLLRAIVFLLVQCMFVDSRVPYLFRTVSLTDATENVFGFMNNQVASKYTAQAVKESWVKYQRGDENAFADLSKNVATLALCNVAGMAAGSLVPFAQLVMQERANFVQSMTAVRNYNNELRRRTEELIAFGKQHNWGEDVLRTQMDTLKRGMRRFSDNYEHGFLDDVRALRSSNPRYYKLIRSSTKWLRRGAKILKVLGPISDLVGTVVNAHTLANTNPRQDPMGFTSAFLGMTSGILGLASFIVGIVLVSNPIGASIALGLSIVSIGLGFLSTGFSWYATPPTPPPPENFDVPMFNRLALANAKSAKERFLKEMEFEWDFTYVMNEAALVKSKPNSITIRPNGDAITFGNTNPMVSRISEADECMGYNDEDWVNIHGVSREFPNLHSRYSCKKAVDFVGVRNNRKPEGSRFYGYNIYALTTSVPEGMTYRTINIDTTNNGHYGDGDDFIYLDSLEHLGASETINIQTGDGHDVLSIGDLIGATTRRNALHADLGPGLNSLSFYAMNESLHRRNFAGIKFNHNVLEFKWSRGTKVTVGVVDGVRIFHSSLYNDEIFLPSDERGNDGSDDLVVFNYRGKNTYTILPVNTGNSRVKRFTILDESVERPILQIIGSQRISIVWKRDKVVIIYTFNLNRGSVSNVQPYAVITWQNLNNGFEINRQSVANPDPRSLPSYFTSGNTKLYPTASERVPTFTDLDDQLILNCTTYDDFHSQIGNEIIDFKGGKDSIMISREFLDICEFEGPGERDILGAEIEGRFPNFQESITLMNSGNNRFSLVFIKPGQRTDIMMKNVERIVSDFGTTLLEFANTEYRELSRINILERYKEVFGYDVEAIENSTNFGPSSAMRMSTSFSGSTNNVKLLFKPEENTFGTLAEFPKENSFLRIALVPAGNRQAKLLFGAHFMQGGNRRMNLFESEPVKGNSWNTLEIRSIRGGRSTPPLTYFELNRRDPVMETGLRYHFADTRMLYFGKLTPLTAGQFSTGQSPLLTKMVEQTDGFVGTLLKVEIGRREVNLRDPNQVQFRAIQHT